MYNNREIGGGRGDYMMRIPQSHKRVQRKTRDVRGKLELPRTVVKRGGARRGRGRNNHTGATPGPENFGATGQIGTEGSPLKSLKHEERKKMWKPVIKRSAPVKSRTSGLCRSELRFDSKTEAQPAICRGPGGRHPREAPRSRGY